MLEIHIPPGRPDWLTLSGELDSHSAPRLQRALSLKLTERHLTFYLDCAELRFLDSRGIAAILQYARDAKDFGGQLVVANASGTVAEVLKVVRLEELFHCCPQPRPAERADERVRPAQGTDLGVQRPG
jgi:anti-sigma B factor antagonist